MEGYGDRHGEKERGDAAALQPLRHPKQIGVRTVDGNNLAPLDKFYHWQSVHKSPSWLPMI